jgi:tripartite-type tricarboxylate transporter receptor subunit TctC
MARVDIRDLCIHSQTDWVAMELAQRRLLRFVATVIVALISSELAWGQSYPARPVTLIVGYAAGGPTDTIARIVAERMKVSLGERVVIENVTGASGSIGVGRVARAAPDGYTLSLGDWSTHVANGAVYRLAYDLLKDFQPVSLLPSSPMLILAREGVPAGTLNELIAWIRKNSGHVSQGTSGAGSPPHIAGAYFQSVTDTQIQMIPYRGAAPAQLDFVAGRTDISIAQASFAFPYVRSGKIKAYAVTARTRWAIAPEIPTVDEAGLPQFYMSIWRGLWAPRNTPKAVIAKVNSAVAETLADPAIQRRLAELGEEIPPREQRTPEALNALQRAEIQKWWPIINAMGIKPE